MKTIHILYNTLIDPKQEQIATEYSRILSDNNYDTKTFCVNSIEAIQKQHKLINPKTCQLILSLNMTGYNIMTTDNCSSLNHLPINIVNIIDCPPAFFSHALKCRMNFTMSFLFTSEEDADYVKEHFPHIRNVFWHPSPMEYLPQYLEELDWRY